MINKYEQITPEHENVKSHTQSVIDKENNKPVNKFNSKNNYCLHQNLLRKINRLNHR